MINGCLGYSEVGDRKCFSLQLCQFQKIYQPQFSLQYPYSFRVSQFSFTVCFSFSNFLLLHVTSISIVNLNSLFLYTFFLSDLCILLCVCFVLFFPFLFAFGSIQFFQMYPIITFYSIVALFCTCFFIFIFFCLGSETLSHYPDQAGLSFLISLLCLVCVRMLACPTLSNSIPHC